MLYFVEIDGKDYMIVRANTQTEAEDVPSGTLTAIEPLICAWYALCHKPANIMRDHPVMGEVPICDDCENKLKGWEA